MMTLGIKDPSKGCSEVPGGRLPTLEHQETPGRTLSPQGTIKTLLPLQGDPR